MSSPPFNALTLYTAGTPNGFKPVIVLEELGLKYDVKPINIMTNEQKQDWYLEINPNGRIPALKDGDLRVFESGAIMLYLTDLYDKEKRFTYEYGSALYYEMVSLRRALRIVFGFVPAPSPPFSVAVLFIVLFVFAGESLIFW